MFLCRWVLVMPKKHITFFLSHPNSHSARIITNNIHSVISIIYCAHTYIICLLLVVCCCAGYCFIYIHACTDVNLASCFQLWFTYCSKSFWCFALLSFHSENFQTHCIRLMSYSRETVATDMCCCVRKRAVASSKCIQFMPCKFFFFIFFAELLCFVLMKAHRSATRYFLIIFRSYKFRLGHNNTTISYRQGIEEATKALNV